MAVAAATMAGLRKLPREAVPETLEILMQATGVDSVKLLGGLLHSVPAEIKEAQDYEVETSVSPAETQKLITYVAALLYLLKSSAQDDNILNKVMWEICIPLLRIQNFNSGPLQIEVIKMMVNTVEILGLWSFMAKMLGRICQQTFIPATGMHEMVGNGLEALLKSAIESIQQEYASMILDKGSEVSAESFCEEVVYNFFEPAMVFLSQPRHSSLRHHAISLLLPPILRTITRLELTPGNRVRSAVPESNRSIAAQKIWESCKILFNHGHLQRHDAYAALAAFAEYFLPPVLLENELLLLQRNPKQFGIDQFDVRDDPFFWEELKAGLVDDDPLIRERALSVLKKAFHNSSKRSDNSNVSEECTTGYILLERWSAFVFLYETLNEYESVHLVDSTFAQKMSFLLPFSKPKSGEKRPWANPGIRSITEGVDVDFKWMSILFQRGFNHENVQVRQMVLRSFLELDWTRAPKVKAFVPEEFVLGPFLSSLDDPAHHQELDQGCSKTTTLAAEFIGSYSASLSERSRREFIQRFAMVFAAKTPCGAGLMSLAICLEAATVPVMEAELFDANKADSSNISAVASGDESLFDLENSPTHLNKIGEDLLDSLQVVVEKSKDHSDQNFRAKVCEHILAAAAAMNQVPCVLVSRLASFISNFPRELFHKGGPLHDNLLKWLHPSRDENGSISPGLDSEKWLRRGLTVMLEEFLRWGIPHTESPLSKDDLRGWEESAQRWTRLLAIGVVSNETQKKIVLLVERCLMETYQRAYMLPHVAEKILLLFRCLLKECDQMWACVEYQAQISPSSSINNVEEGVVTGSRLAQYVADSMLNTLDILAQNAKKSAGVFWEYRGSRLFRVLNLPTEARSQETESNEGPSARASAVMQGVLAVTTLAEGCIWYCRLRSAAEIPEGVINFFWDFAWKVVTTPAAKTEAGAEVQLGSYEALAPVCGAWAATVSPVVVPTAMGHVLDKDPFSAITAATVVDTLVTALGTNVQAIIRKGLLTKARCEALTSYKWSSLEHLLSIPKAAVARLKEGAYHPVNRSESSIGMSVLQDTLQDAIDSLGSAGEEYLVPLLLSIRWLMQWNVLLPGDPSEEAQEKSVQIMWTLVQSGWGTMAKCNRARVAIWAAFLSAILHPAVFGNKEMHEAGIHEDDGPLKWLICRLITKGDSNPRAMRLTAIHMSGLWLQFPTTLTCYNDQLKVLALHGEGVVDKDVDGDAIKNQDEAIKGKMLWRGFGLEISETYLNSEVYARVTIAVMLHLIAQVVETAENTQDIHKLEAAKPGAECGRKLLLDLLTHVVEDSDLTQEKYATSTLSSTPRQNLRAWQMLCILSQYVSIREIDQVTSLLEIAIERNDILPSVRHYIEVFAIRVFLKFPYLIEKHIVPILHDYSMRGQALSSYISIAVNVVLCTSSADLGLDHLRHVLPAIFPFMMTTHPSTNAFTQVLVYRILQRWLTGSEKFFSGPVDCANTDQSSLDRVCLQSLTAYMERNADCMRMKPSVDLYLGSFDAVFATTPQGVFCKQGQDDRTENNGVPTDRVSVTVLHQIYRFLNSARGVSTEMCFREEPIRKEDSFKVLSSKSAGKQMPSGSVSKNGDPEHLHSSLLSPDTLPRSEISTSGSVDSTTWSSDAVSHSQKLRPQVRSPFQKPGNSDRYYDGKNNSSLTKLGSRKHAQDDQLQVRGPRRELIVVATAPAESSALAGFARTCEVFEIAKLVKANTEKSQEYYDNRLTPTYSVPFEVLETSLKKYLNIKRKEGFALLGLMKGAGSVPVGNYLFPNRSVLILGGEYGLRTDIIPMLDALIEVTNPDGQHPLDIFVGASIVLWEYAQQHRPPSRPNVTPRLSEIDKAGAQMYTKI